MAETKSRDGLLATLVPALTATSAPIVDVLRWE